MKLFKFTLGFLILLLSFGISKAQESTNYEKGDLLLSGGLSFGTYGYGYLGSRSGGVVPLTASGEYSINEQFGVGPYLGYANWNYDYLGADYSWSFLALGGRGSFHATPLLNELFGSDMDSEELDIYVAVLLGLDIRTYSGSSDVYANDSDVNLVLGPVLGCRYYFSDNFGVYFEGGRGAFGLGTLGVSYKL